MFLGDLDWLLLPAWLRFPVVGLSFFLFSFAQYHSSILVFTTSIDLV